jgi:hypothetical protein
MMALMRPDRSVRPRRIRNRVTLKKLASQQSDAPDALDRLTAWKRLSEHNQAVLIDLVTEARRQDVSWADIGAALEVSKQAVMQRFGPSGTYDVEKLRTGHRSNK